MAEDKLNDGSEEERKSSNDMSDDDFGLPDLEFDELQELDMSFDDEEGSDDAPVQEEKPTPSDSPLSGSDDIDMSVLDDIPSLGGDEPSADEGLSNTILDEGIDEVEDVLDSAQLISDRLGDEEDDDTTNTDFGSSVNYDELIGGDSTESSSEDSSDSIFASDSEEDSLFGADDSSDDDIMSSDDLLASIDSPDDLAALGMADDEEEESTDSLFASDDPSSTDFGSSSDEDSLFDSDSISFGSSEEEEPISNETGDNKLPENYKAYTYNESSGGFTKIIVIGVIVIAVVAAGMLWLSNGPDEPEKKVAKVEKTKPEPKKEEPTTPVAEVEETTETTAETSKPEEPIEEPSNTRSTEASAAPAGEIVRVSDRTGLSYIIIGSFIDEDLAMDYAKELSGQGRGVKIIAPFGKSKRYRLSIADYSTYGDAASQLGQYQSEFGDQVWALKY